MAKSYCPKNMGIHLTPSNGQMPCRYHDDTKSMNVWLGHTSDMVDKIVRVKYRTILQADVHEGIECIEWPNTETY